MARKNGRKENGPGFFRTLPPDTKKGIVVVLLVVAGLFLTLAAFGIAGIAGSDAYRLFAYLLGVGYFLLPLVFFLLAGNALRGEPGESAGFDFLKITASIAFIIAGLGFIAIVSGKGGMVGAFVANPVVRLFDIYAAMILLGGIALISLLVLLEGRISMEPFVGAWRLIVLGVQKLLAKLFKKSAVEAALENLPLETEDQANEEDAEYAGGGEADLQQPALQKTAESKKREQTMQTLRSLLGTYTPPPLSLLEHDRGRPGVGDIKANANIIKRTLQNFGITVELDEISIGPSVTRYAIKPAEGVRLQKIVSLQTNLELALAAHPVRIEAPIPGKSLVGIEVPNHTKMTVGLGTIFESPEFTHSNKPLLVVLGRDIAGGSVFGNLGKMPHLLIAGATGSGKSVAIHAIITSLLYRLGPSQLRFLMIDPKRVELTMYNHIPHLLAPVITDPKRAIMALRWAAKEMERRYNVFEQEQVRDIDSYHQNILAPALESLRHSGGMPAEGEKIPEAMPYIIIIIDELADIMSSYPRELEAAVVRLAQMSRAVGIHLLLSTQRPSVNVITGLIKANIPARMALQVASQIDSRTILDQGGAEKLLGAGDMLWLSGDMGKPSRLQSAFISEGEVKKVVSFIAKHNEAQLPVDITPQVGSLTSLGSQTSSFDTEEEIDDDMYKAARAAVLEAGKASTSYLQRKLRVGYARAARLIDVLEERGIIGPGDGAKPREILERNEAESAEQKSGAAEARSEDF